MFHQAFSAPEDASVEQYVTPLVKALSCLEAIKEQLVVNTTSDTTCVTLCYIISQLHETRKLFRTLPDSIPSSIPTDALLKKIQLAIIDLYIARDQLETKGKSRRFYTYTLSSFEHLESALALQRNFYIVPTEEAPQKISYVPAELHSTQGSTRHFFTQLRHFRIKLLDIKKLLRSLHGSDCHLALQSNDWAIIYNPLQDFYKTLRIVCSLLDNSIYLLIAQSIHYSQLVTLLYIMVEQVQGLIALTNTYQTLRNKRSKRAITIRQDTQLLLGEFLQKSDSADCHIAHLLDQSRFPIYGAHIRQAAHNNARPK